MPGVRACARVCVFSMCKREWTSTVTAISEREQHSLGLALKTSRLPHTSVSFAHAPSDATRAIFLQRLVCVCLHVARVTGRVVSDRLGLA